MLRCQGKLLVVFIVLALGLSSLGQPQAEPKPETEDLIESIRQLKFMPEGRAQGLLRDVPEVSIAISQKGPAPLSEESLRESIEEALNGIGVGVVTDTRVGPGSCMCPILIVSIDTSFSGPVICHSLTLSVMDWMRPISAPHERIFCPCHYVSAFGFSSPANAIDDLTLQIQLALKDFCQFWQQSLATRRATVGNGSPAYIVLTGSDLESVGNPEVVRRAILANLSQITVAVDLEGLETSVLVADRVKHRIVSRLEALGLEHVTLEQSFQQWEKTGQVPATLTLSVRTTSNGQGYSALLVELFVHASTVRASVPDFALHSVVHTDGVFGADTSRQLRAELSDRVEAIVTKFVNDLRLARQMYPQAAEHLEMRPPSQTAWRDIKASLPYEPTPETTGMPSKTENQGHTHPAATSEPEVSGTIPSEVDTPELRQALNELSPATRQEVIDALNEDEFKQLPSGLRQQMAVNLARQFKFCDVYLTGPEPQTNGHQEPPFEHLDHGVASNVVDYRRPAAFSPTNYFETVRWWVGTFNIAHRYKLTGNALRVREDAKKQFRPFIGKPMAWVMKVRSVSKSYVEFYGDTIPRQERENKNLYPNGTSGMVIVGNSPFQIHLSIGSQVSKAQALSLGRDTCVVVQGRFKDMRVGYDGDLQISLDNIILTPTEDVRGGTIYP